MNRANGGIGVGGGKGVLVGVTIAAAVDVDARINLLSTASTLVLTVCKFPCRVANAVLASTRLAWTVLELLPVDEEDSKRAKITTLSKENRVTPIKSPSVILLVPPALEDSNLLFCSN